MRNPASLVAAEQNGHAPACRCHGMLTRVRGIAIQPRPLQHSPSPDWNAGAARILAILLTIKRQRRACIREAARRGITLDQLTAASITGAVAELVEGAEEGKKSPRARLRG